jgi:ADP-heptose:LPS heptosyltransferase
MTKKIYFGINGQFGDILIQEPTLRKLTKTHPEAQIILGCHKKYSEVLELFKDYHPNIIEHKIWEGYNNWPTKSDNQYIDEQGFDLFYHPMPKHPDGPHWVEKRHIVKEMGYMRQIELNDSELQLSLPCNYDIRKKQKTVSISLFPSDWRVKGIKSLTYEMIRGIVKVVTSLGYDIIHLNGPDEPDVPNTKKVNGTYVQSVGQMLSTDLLITCDTSMMWAASAFKHPTIGLFSWGYNPIAKTTKNWQPVNPNAIYLEDYAARNIKKQDIIKALCDKLRKEDNE